MTWSDVLTNIALGAASLAVPALIVLARQWIAAHVKNEQIKQWMDGAAVAGGRGYIALMEAKRRNPTVPLSSLARQVAEAEGQTFFAAYREKSAAIGATPVDAETRVLGELGAKLAADPSVSVLGTVRLGTAAEARLPLPDGNP
ncbi:MAG: hypothetical protein WDN25_13520 [Acetobacteraceae bacterium]